MIRTQLNTPSVVTVIQVLMSTFCILAVSTQRSSADPAVTWANLTTDGRTQTSFVLGWDFVPTSDISVTALGYYAGSDSNNLFQGTHQVGIFDGQTLVDGISAILNLSNQGTLDNGYRYLTLGTPISLTEGVTYTLVGTTDGNGDVFGYFVTNLLTSPLITLPGGVSSSPIQGNGYYDFGDTLENPPLVGNTNIYAGPNMMITSNTQESPGTPEPGAWALLAATGVMGVGFASKSKWLRRKSA